MYKEVEVDGWVYLISHPNPEVAWEIGIELSKIIGESLVGVAQVAADGNPEKAAEAIPMAIKGLLSKVDPKNSMQLIKKILHSVEVQGEVSGERKKFHLNDNAFRLHFQGRIGSMMKIVAETLKFTHEDFFVTIKDGIVKLVQEIAA
jgi:hypothetical protein